jgi:hypothetical protein
MRVINECGSEAQSTGGAAVNLMKATVFFGWTDASPSATYTVIAASAAKRRN